MNSNWDEHWIRILICLWFQGFVWYFKVCGNQCRTRTSKTLEGAPGFFFGPPPRTGMVVLSEQWVCGEKSRDFMTQTHCSLKTTIPVLGGGPKKIRAPLRGARLGCTSPTLITTHLEVPNKTLKILSNAYFIFILLCYFNKDLYTIGLLRYPWRGQLAKRPMGWQLLMTTAMSDWVSAEEKVSCVNFASGHCYLNS